MDHIAENQALASDLMGKKYHCSSCGYSVDRLDNYKRHMRRHTGEMFQCDSCGLQYNSKYRLQKHIEQKHAFPNVAQALHFKAAGLVNVESGLLADNCGLLKLDYYRLDKGKDNVVVKDRLCSGEGQFSEIKLISTACGKTKLDHGQTDSI